MVAGLAPFIGLVTLALAGVAAAMGAIELLGERPSNALVYFAIAAGTWGIGRAMELVLGAKKTVAKPNRA